MLFDYYEGQTGFFCNLIDGKPVLVWICQSSYIPIQRLASNFFQDREDTVQLLMWLQIFYFKPRRENFTGLWFCPDLSLSRSTDHRDRNLHSLSYRFQ